MCNLPAIAKNFLNFTKCHCLQLCAECLDKKCLAFQSSKASYLKLRLSFGISFLDFLEFNEECYYVVLRTSLLFQGLPM